MTDKGYVDPPDGHEDDRCWLKFPVTDNRPPVQVSLISYRPNDKCRIEFSNLTDKERDALQAMSIGRFWCRVVHGRVHAYEAFEGLPDPVDDPLCAPHWKAGAELKEFGKIPEDEGWHDPAIIISHLGAGDTWPNAYERNARKLLECGFDCLRSKRGNDGKIWEQWVLHGLWQADGRLKEHMDSWEGRDWQAKVNEAARFLTRDLQVCYGTLDITVQRWALANPD